MATNVILPRQGQSVETCIIGELYKKKGDFVNEGDIILSFETDKAEFELEAPVSGVILEFFHNTGDEVAVLSTMAIIGNSDESLESENSVNDNDVASHVISSDVISENEKSNLADDINPISSPSERGERIKITPRARNLASRLNIDISVVTGSGPMGKILEKDIEAAANAREPNNTVSSENFEEQEDSAEFTLAKLTNVRRIIAEKMHTSLTTSAQLTHHLSAKAGNLLTVKEKIKSTAQNESVENITVNDLICFALIRALKKNQTVNAHFLDDSIKTFHRVHLGIAVNTDRGLMVPVLKNADEYSLSTLSKALKALIEQCRNGKIDPELLSGYAASFTVSNLGSFGVEMFTPVLNLPQVAILGVNTITNRLEQSSSGEILSIPYLGLSLTYDHRAMDGVPASIFLAEVKNQIETLSIDVN